MSDALTVVGGQGEKARRLGLARAAYRAQVVAGVVSPRIDVPTVAAWHSLLAGADSHALLGRVTVDPMLAAGLVGAALSRGSAGAREMSRMMTLAIHPADDGFAPVWSGPRPVTHVDRIDELVNLHQHVGEPLDDLISWVARWCMDWENSNSPLLAPMAELLAGRPDRARQMLDVAEYPVPDWVRDAVRVHCHRQVIARATDVLWRGQQRERAVLDYLEVEPPLDPREILKALIPLYEVLTFEPRSDAEPVRSCRPEQLRQTQVLREGLLELLGARLNGLSREEGFLELAGTAALVRDRTDLADPETLVDLRDALEGASSQLDPLVEEANEAWWARSLGVILAGESPVLEPLKEG